MMFKTFRKLLQVPSPCEKCQSYVCAFTCHALLIQPPVSDVAKIGILQNMHKHRLHLSLQCPYLRRRRMTRRSWPASKTWASARATTTPTRGATPAAARLTVCACCGQVSNKYFWARQIFRKPPSHPGISCFSMWSFPNSKTQKNFSKWKCKDIFKWNSFITKWLKDECFLILIVVD